jgi:putative transposase
MRAKRYTAEQIVAMLREAEKLQAQGLTIPQACKRLGILDQTFYRWRIKYGALKEDEAQRLRALEQENARLKKIVAEQALDISMLKDLVGFVNSVVPDFQGNPGPVVCGMSAAIRHSGAQKSSDSSGCVNVCQ